jgi:membrane protein YqaA with SNARE-associated domain
VNYGLGFAVIKSINQSFITKKFVFYCKAQAWAKRFGGYLLLLSTAAFGPVICLAAGFFKVPLKTTIPMMILGAVIFYVFMV